MNQKLQTYIYYGLSLVSLVVIAISIKYLLGGYNEIVIRKGGAIDFTIAGKYVTISDTKQFGELNYELDQLTESGKLVGEMTQVYTFEGTLIDAEVFVGILFPNNIISLPGWMEVVPFKFEQQLSCELKMHSLVRPSREKMLQMLSKQAEASQQSLEGTLFEVKSSGSLIYIAPLSVN